MGWRIETGAVITAISIIFFIIGTGFGFRSGRDIACREICFPYRVNSDRRDGCWCEKPSGPERMSVCGHD